MLKEICPDSQCTGCMACQNSCAHSAIEIITDPLGFRFPRINADRCVDCGLCRQACPQLNPRTLVFPSECYAAVIKPSEQLLTCASGGAATALAVPVIEAGGLVVGCSGQEMKHVCHIKVETLEDLSLLKGSKYVQSEISGTLFKDIRTELLKGRRVMFFGTPCQVAGLQNFLRKPFENLVTVDLVCHGVPSQQMLNDNMALYPGLDPNSVKFRIKEDPKANGSAIRYGWSQTTHSDESAKPIFTLWDKDPYLAAFMRCLTFRPGCYQCSYAFSARQSDITICDFWGLGPDSALANSAGVSAILINTPKGKEAFNAAMPNMDTERRTVAEAIIGNGQLQIPSKRNPYRAKFEQIYKTQGWKAAIDATAFKQLKKEKLKQLPIKILRKLRK